MMFEHPHLRSNIKYDDLSSSIEMKVHILHRGIFTSHVDPIVIEQLKKIFIRYMKIRVFFSKGKFV